MKVGLICKSYACFFSAAMLLRLGLKLKLSQVLTALVIVFRLFAAERDQSSI